MQVIETWPEYVRRVAGKLTHAEISAKTNGLVSSSSAGRWLRGEPGNPDAAGVIAFAKAFRRSPLEALHAAGYLDAGDVIPQARTPLSEYSMRELLDELGRRNPE